MQNHFHANQSHFHKNGFALSLALKQRRKGTLTTTKKRILGTRQVTVLPRGDRRSHLLNKYVVNGEQGCKGLIFACSKDDLKSVVSIDVYRWVCRKGQFLFFHCREGR